MSRRFAAALAVALPVIAAASAHAISFIDSPSPVCRKIKGNECAISWYYLSVNASPNYMITMRVLVGPVGGTQKLVYHVGGFFQTSMYVPHEMIGDSIKVPCGKAGSSPDPEPSPSPGYLYGASYNFTIQGRDSSNMKSANYGTVRCPPK
jgi:hypothetical protein